MVITPERRRALRLALAGLLLALAPAVLAFALPPQHTPVKDYALIYGTVFGPDGLSRYGVPVKIRRAGDKKARWGTTSDHAGEFAVRVPVGAADYLVWADIKVAQGQAKPEAQVHIENNERVDVSLHLKQ